MSRAERIAAILDGLSRSLSTTDIAIEIGGCSRNSIIGLAHRAKLQLGPKQRRSKKTTAASPVATKKAAPVKLEKAPKKTRELVIGAMKKVVAVPAVVTEPVYEFPDAHYRVLLDDVKSGHCRYPTWGDAHRPGTETYFFCGKPVRSDSPYCWHCHIKTHDTAVGPKRQPARKPSARLTRRGEVA
ncbi:GcrA family cell cycle regulator [Mesorhizobium sp. M0189]